MEIERVITVLDAPDIEVESAFWAALLGGTVVKREGWHRIHVDGQPCLAVQYAPNHVAPDWPDGSPPQQMHLDLWITDIGPVEERAIALGARRLKNVDEEGFRVYADPAGHPFCLCWE